MLLRYTGKLEQEACDVEEAIDSVLEAGYRTADIDRDKSGRLATTSEIGELVVDAVTEIADRRHAYHAV